MKLEDIEKELHLVKHLNETNKDNMEKAKTALGESEHNAQVVDLSTKILEAYLESVSSTVSGTLETLMASALQVFNMGINVTLEYKAGSRGGYSTVVEQGGVTGGINSFGGGVMSLVSFIMLVSTIVLKEKRKLIILDESLKEVSEEYQAPLSTFMRQLCDDFGFTIMLISHQPELNVEANICYEVGTGKNGTTIRVSDS